MVPMAEAVRTCQCGGRIGEDGNDGSRRNRRAAEGAVSPSPSVKWQLPISCLLPASVGLRGPFAFPTKRILSLS